MYVRFLGHATAKLGLRGQPVVRTGIFCTAYPLSRHEGAPDWLRAEVRRELDWFETYLPVPGGGVFWVKSQRRWRRQGLCWFRPDATAMISHAFNLRALIEEYGIGVDVVKTDRPGSVLYRDDYQVVARPDTYRIRWRPRGSPRGRCAGHRWRTALLRRFRHILFGRPAQARAARGARLVQPPFGRMHRGLLEQLGIARLRLLGEVAKAPDEAVELVLRLALGRLDQHRPVHDQREIHGHGVETIDFAKAMIDEGYHPMTMYFP